MSRRHSIVILTLFAIPILVFGALGTYVLWEQGWLFWTWWLLPICWGVAYWLARRRAWTRQLRQPPVPKLPKYWTEQDYEAWKIVKRAAEAASGIAPSSLLEPEFYLRSAQNLVLEITRFYHPKADDPMAPVTVHELLTATQLVIEDLANTVDVYVPASRHLTVKRWKSMRHLPKWYRHASNLSYAISAAFGPLAAASRYALAKSILTPAIQALQDNVVYWFYAAFLQRVGFYAIELNSGRLQVGAARWRELVRASDPPSTAAPQSSTDTAPASTTPLTITVVGQLKAGKSSIVNALLGRSDAPYDPLPATQVVSRYELVGDDWIGSLVVQDTPGYGGLDNASTIEQAAAACADSDIILLAADVLNAARDPDQRFLDALQQWFQSRPQFRRPPVVVALTHVDLLSPAMEWSPPYAAWKGSEPTSPKDESIRAAVEALQSTTFNQATAVVPVCTGPTSDRMSGVDEWLIPAILAQMEEARAVLLLRALHRESRLHKWRRVWQQTWQAGSTVVSKALRL